jgi:hypothetical protein
MVFNATFNNISAISWRSVLLLEETGVPGENNRPVGKFFFSSKISKISCCKVQDQIINFLHLFGQDMFFVKIWQHVLIIKKKKTFDQ